MTSRRDDGLSIAVWENSPWRAFVRFKDSADAEGQSGRSSPPSSSRYVSVSRPNNHTDFTEDVRAIFGRALDTARDKKSFASASSVTSSRKDLIKSEVRLLAEGNRSWGSGRYYNATRDEYTSCDEMADFSAEEGEEEAVAPAVESDGSPQPPPEHLNGCPPLQSSSFVAAGATKLQRVTSTAGGLGEEPHRRGTPGAAWLRTLSTAPGSAGSDRSQRQLSPGTRSPRGSGTSVTGSTSVGDGGSSAGASGSPGGGPRGRAARVTALVSPASTKLLHIHAATASVRLSLDVYPSRKQLSPLGALQPLRRSNSFDAGRANDNTAAAAAADPTAAPPLPPTTVAVVSAAVSAGATSVALFRDREAVSPLRDRRSHTVTGSLPAAAIQYGAGPGACRPGGGGGGGGGMVSPRATHREWTPQLNKPRRGLLLAGDGRCVTSRDVGDSDRGAGLGHCPSGRLPEPYGSRLQPMPLPYKSASSRMVAAMVAPATPRGGRSHPTHSPTAADGRKQPTAAVAGDCGRGQVSAGGGAPVSPRNSMRDGRNVLVRLQGLMRPQ